MHAGLEGFAVPEDGLGAADDDGVSRHDDAALGVALDELALRGVENGRRGGDDDAGGDHGPFFHDGPLINTAVAAYKGSVFNDGRDGAGGLEDAADLGGRGDMDVLPYLGAGTDGDVGVDHGARADIGADVDIGRRHDDAAGSEIGAAADAGAARDDAYAVLGREMPHREGVLVVEGELALGHVTDSTELEAGEDDFLDVAVDRPDAVFLFGDADLAFFEGLDGLVEFLEGYFVGHSAARVSCMRVSVFSVAGTSGRRRTFSIRPSRAMAALAGIGFDSTKQCLNSGMRR